MELILVVVISAGMAENSQNGVSRSLRHGQNGHVSRAPRLQGPRAPRFIFVTLIILNLLTKLCLSQ